LCGGSDRKWLCCVPCVKTKLLYRKSHDFQSEFLLLVDMAEEEQNSCVRVTMILFLLISMHYLLYKCCVHCYRVPCLGCHMSASLLSLRMFSATVLDWVPFRTSLAQVGWFSVGCLYSHSSQMLRKVFFLLMSCSCVNRIVSSRSSSNCDGDW